MDTTVYATPERLAIHQLKISDLRPLILSGPTEVSQNPFHLYEYIDDVAWFLAGYYMEAYNIFMSQIPKDSSVWDFVNDDPEDALFVCDYVINEIMHQITPEGYRWGDKHEDDPTLGYWPWELS